MLLLLDRGPEPQQVIRHGLPSAPQHIHQPASQALILLCEEGDGGPVLPCASSPPNAMHIVLGRQRERDIDHELDVGDIEATGCDICGDEDVDVAILERLEAAFAGGLGEVAVDAGDGEAVAADQVFDAGCFFLVEAEDEDALVAGLFLEELEQAGLLVVAVHDFDGLLDAWVGAQLAVVVEGAVFVGVAADGDADGVAHEGCGQVADGLGPGGGEHGGLTLGGGWHGGDDVFDVVFEAFVEHAICFVEDEVAGLGEVDGAVRHEVFQTARGGDDDVAAGEVTALFILVGAAVDACCF